MNRKIAFGTDGWRAIIADQFTVENVKVVAQAIADYTIENNMQEQGIIIGHDTRFMGRMFALEVVSVLAGNGIRTYLVNEATPTPVVAFGVRHFATSGAIMITASHNPPAYNGIKYIPEYAGPAKPEITRRLEELIAERQAMGGIKYITLDEASDRELMESIFLRPHYEAHLRRMINFEVLKQGRLSIVVDPMHGAGIGYVSRMLAEAHVQTATIRDTHDPLFGGDLPEPNERHLRQLQYEVVQREASLGLANDGDADRFGVVDRFGNYIPPNKILTLLAWHLIKNRKQSGRIIRTVATTHQLDRVAERYGLEIVETPVGFKYISEQMMAGQVLLGGEESGGGSIAGHIPEKDGILINLLLAELCAWEQKPVDQVLQQFHEEFGEVYSSRLDIELSGKERLAKQLIETPPRDVGPYSVVAINRMDGLKMSLAEGHWVLIRPSGTEPLLRVYCEANSAEALEKIKEAVGDWFFGL